LSEPPPKPRPATAYERAAFERFEAARPRVEQALADLGVAVREDLRCGAPLPAEFAYSIFGRRGAAPVQVALMPVDRPSREIPESWFDERATYVGSSLDHHVFVVAELGDRAALAPVCDGLRRALGLVDDPRVRAASVVEPPVLAAHAKLREALAPTDVRVGPIAAPGSPVGWSAPGWRVGVGRLCVVGIRLWIAPGTDAPKPAPLAPAERERERAVFLGAAHGCRWFIDREDNRAGISIAQALHLPPPAAE
jgi:hypothetical protein